MSAVDTFFSPHGRLSRGGFFLCLIALAAVVSCAYFLADWAVLHFLEHGAKEPAAETEVQGEGGEAAEAAAPAHSVGHTGERIMMPLVYFCTIVAGIVCGCIGLMQLIKRLHDMGRRGILSVLMLVPGVNVLFLLYTLVAPSREGAASGA